MDLRDRSMILERRVDVSGQVTKHKRQTGLYRFIGNPLLAGKY